MVNIVPWSEIEPVSPALEVWVLNHWTAWNPSMIHSKPGLMRKIFKKKVWNDNWFVRKLTISLDFSYCQYTSFLSNVLIYLFYFILFFSKQVQNSANFTILISQWKKPLTVSSFCYLNILMNNSLIVCLVKTR